MTISDNFIQYKLVELFIMTNHMGVDNQKHTFRDVTTPWAWTHWSQCGAATLTLSVLHPPSSFPELLPKDQNRTQNVVRVVISE